MPWRIVIDRLGRLGHGELKSELSRKNKKQVWNVPLITLPRLGNHSLEAQSSPICHARTRILSHVPFVTQPRSSSYPVGMLGLDGDAFVVGHPSEIG